MQPGTETTPPRRKPWLRILLGTSLALNLLFVGLAAGIALRMGGAERHRPPVSSSLGVQLLRTLPEPDRRAVWKEARRIAAQNGRNGRAEADAGALDAALRAQPFDRAAVGEILDTQLAGRNDWLRAVQAVWIERISAMSDADRAEYADRLHRALTARHGPRPAVRPRN